MYKKERVGQEKNLIALTLTNGSAVSDSDINLFSLGTFSNGSNNGATTNAQQISVTNASFSGTVAWAFTYNTSLIQSIPDPTSIDDLISKLNAIFTENGQGIFWKVVNVVGVSWYLRVASSAYVFVDEQHAASPINTFATFATNYISGTSVSVDMGNDITYIQASEELTHQPYIITTVYVYSSTQSQVITPFSVQKIDPNGASRARPVKPQLSPEQIQNVQMAVPIYMTTSALNQLQYTVLARASVKMIVRYESIDLFDAGKLLDSGEFQYQMKELMLRDTEEYKRIMNVVTGGDYIEDVENSNPSWNKTNSQVVVDPPKYYVVPLIFVVEKENGNKSVLML